MKRSRRAQKRIRKQQAARLERLQPGELDGPKPVVDGGQLAADSDKPEVDEPVQAVKDQDPQAEQARGEVDELNDGFFHEAPATFPPQEIWDEELGRPPRRARSSRFAQYATFAMMGLFLVGIGSYTFYNRVIMPAPVEVGPASGAPESPFPEQAGSQAPHPAPADFERAAAAQPAPESAIALGAAQAAAEPVTAEPVAAEPVAAPETAPAVVVEEPERNEVAATAAVLPVAVAKSPAKSAARSAPPNRTVSLPATGPTARPKARPARTGFKRAATNRRAPTRRAALSRTSSSRTGAGDSQPNRADVLRKMAYYYLNSGRHRDAERYASRAVGADPRSSQGWILLGLARDGLQDVEGAKSAFQRCTQAEGPYVSECRRLEAGYM